MKMKNIRLLLLCTLGVAVQAQEITEKKVTTEAHEVTVFTQGAQITRKKSVDLSPGISILNFTDLSPFIDAKSIQVKALGNVTVLSVNHRQDFLKPTEKSKELTDLETQLTDLNSRIKLENTYLQIIAEELAFLNDNRDVTTGIKDISLQTLKDASGFYSANLKALKLKEIDHYKNLEDLLKQKDNLERQIQSLTTKKEYPAGEIVVKVDAKQTNRATFEISYLVSNAGWFPSYDIRAKSITDPVELIYKANVKQDTKEDWKNVRLKFSSSNPNQTGMAPELKPYLLQYNTLPPVYTRGTGTVSGRVTDASTGEALPGANVYIEGSTIGTVTDANGNYTLTLPAQSGTLVFSYIGYITQTSSVYQPVIHVALTPDVTALDEVVVIGYGTSTEPELALQGKMAGLDVRKAETMRIRGTNMPLPMQKTEKQTTVDFEIKTPYTVPSDNKSYAVDMQVYSLPAMYQYYCVPKVDKDAFLIAHVVDWEKYSLLEGEANIFFEDTYVGKSLLDMRYASDTLKISLGRDKSVTVQREKSRAFTSRQLIGSKKDESRDWLITVKNTKSQPIHMLLKDQVPVSTMEEIEVEVQAPGASQNAENGEVQWTFTLQPNEKREFELKYSVKYPKHQYLIIE
jgi:hypothetical protein